GPGNGGKMSVSIVSIQNIRLTQFEQPALWLEFELVTIFRLELKLAIDFQQIQAGAADGGGSVISHIQIECTVAPQISQGHGHGTKLSHQATISCFSKMPFAVVNEQSGPSADRVNQQIEISVPVHIGKNRAGRILSGAPHTRLIG